MSEAREQGGRLRLLHLALLAILSALLVWRLGWFLFDTHRAVVYPFELDYGEGIVWQQAVMMLRGDAYGDITRYPFIVFHYPPVYHLLAMATAALTRLDPLTAGRTLSVAATLASALFSGLIARDYIRARGDTGAINGLVAALVSLSFIPVHLWAPLMRIDMVALAFTLAGSFFAMKAIARPRFIHAAALCFTLAVYTRQTMLPAPAACFAILLLARPRTALMGIASGLALSLAALAILGWMTGTGFLEHVLAYNVNRFQLERLTYVAQFLQTYPLYLMVAGYALWVMARRPGGWRDDANVMAAMLGLYALLATLSLLLYAKSGANINYMVECCCVVAILIGIAVPRLDARPILLLVPLAIIVQLLIVSKPSYAGNIAIPPSLAERTALVDEVRRADKPVLSDDMVVLMQAGKQVPWEAAIFAELASANRWDLHRVSRLIEQRDFAFIITFNSYYDDRYRPPLGPAIDRFYPRKRPFGAYTIHYPEAVR